MKIDNIAAEDSMNVSETENCQMIAEGTVVHMDIS